MSAMMGHRGLMMARITDTDWSFVQALLHFDGAQASTVMTDEKGGTWEALHADLEQSAAVFGSAALALRQSANTARNISKTSDFLNVGTGDYSIELIAKKTVQVTGGHFILLDMDGTGYPAISFYSDGTSAGIAWRIAGTWRTVMNTAVATGTPWHIKLIRSSGVARLYLNGTQIDSFNSTTSYVSASVKCTVGNNSTLNSPHYGFIEELRITKKVRPTDNQTAAFPNG